MSAFDLKTAVNLLPCMDGTEEKAHSLIDAIELYDSMLNNDGKILLINFILKTRLSTSAKLRLKTTYATVIELVQDMKTHLLTQKSDTALQSKLLRTRQNNKSIEEFGRELEDIFVDLTISQAKGNNAAYELLRPINEKNAIKRFADGLRSQRISTIIAARDFSSLKDAIRAAQDEESSQTANNNQIMTSSFSNNSRKFNTTNRTKYFRYGNRYPNNRNFNVSDQRLMQNQNYRPQDSNFSRGRGTNNNYYSRDQTFRNTNQLRNQQPNGNRRFISRRGRGQPTQRISNNRSINFAEENNISNSQNDSEQHINYFFRESEN